MSSKRMTLSDKEFIINNIGKLPKKELCEKTGFSRHNINEFLKREHNKLYQEKVKFKPAPPKEKKERKSVNEPGETNTYSLMVKYANIKGYKNLQEALKLPHRYEFLKQFRRTIKSTKNN